MVKYEPLVSVIIPAYNEEYNIKHCLESILNVDYPKDKLEIIVVNDGSTDRTLEILESYPRIKIINFTKNMGVGAARNSGIENAKGEILLFLDADCIADKNLVKEHVKHYPEYDCVTGAYMPRKGNTLLSLYSYYLAKVVWTDEHASPTFNNGSFKKEIFRDEKFDEEFEFGHEDRDLSIRILSKGYKRRLEENAIVEHIFEERSFLTILKKGIIGGTGHIIFLKKHFRIRSVLPILILPALVFITLKLGINGLVVVFLILCVTPPSILIIYKMNKSAGLKYFLPFLAINFLLKMVVYLGIDYGLIKVALKDLKKKIEVKVTN